MEKNNHIEVHEPEFAKQKILKVLDSDWSLIKNEVDKIEDTKFSWGGLAFTLLGFGFSMILSTFFYHAAEPSPRNEIVYVGYVLGTCLSIIALPILGLQKTSVVSPIEIKNTLNNYIEKIERFNIWSNIPDNKESISDKSNNNDTNSKDDKDKLFKKLAAYNTFNKDSKWQK